MSINLNDPTLNNPHSKTQVQSLLWANWPETLATTLAKTYTLPGDLVVVPFCDSATPIDELYRAGRKVLVSGQDHLSHLVVEAKLTALDRETIADTFNRLSNSLKGGQPLRQYIENLYQTTCPHCQAPLTADYFVWRRDLADPQQKKVSCTSCKFSGLSDVIQADLHRLDQVETRGIHYHFLLGRTISPHSTSDTVLQTKIEALHELYTPRALYAIAEIIMKIEVVISDKPIQRVFKAILLNCLLSASNLFDPVSSAHLPRYLRPPARFLEHNFWQLFETSVAAWQPPNDGTRITPRLTDFLRHRQNSIHFFPDEAIHLRRYLNDETVTLLLTTPPSHNPIVWALSTLWAGWLLGLKSAESGYRFLKQKGADWTWYQDNLIKTLRALRPTMKPEARWIFILFPEHRLHPPAVVLAALRSRFEVYAWRITSTHHQLTLTLPSAETPFRIPPHTLQATIQTEIRDTINSFLRRQGQPESAHPLIWAAWQSLLYSGFLDQALISLPNKQLLTWLDKQIQQVIEDFGF